MSGFYQIPSANKKRRIINSFQFLFLVLHLRILFLMQSNNTSGVNTGKKKINKTSSKYSNQFLSIYPATIVSNCIRSHLNEWFASCLFSIENDIVMNTNFLTTIKKRIEIDLK